MGETIIGYFGAVGFKLTMRPTERATFSSAWATKKLRGVCVCAGALYGNAATRMSEIVPSDGSYAYGGYPDIDALYKQQAREIDRKKRETLLNQGGILGPLQCMPRDNGFLAGQSRCRKSSRWMG
jgi:peptide/nickel transport system substrate-binding protein